MIKIAKALQNVPSLIEFSISSNNIGSDAVDDIVAVLSNTKLQHFYIKESNLETSGTIKIARALQHVSSLTEFSISSNNIDSEALDYIASLLFHNYH